MDVRGEHRDHDRALGLGDEPLEHLADVRLVPGRALRVDVGGVAHQERDARVAERAEAVRVQVLAVRRPLVELEVAGVDHDAGVGRDRERGGVRDRVRDADRLDAERADRERLAGGRLDQPRVLEDLVLAQSLAHEAERVRRPVDRDVVSLEEVRQRADVVLVAVRDRDPGDVDAEPVEGREVRMDHVDAEPAVVERDPAVDDQRLPALHDRHAVHADLAEASERNDADHVRIDTTSV